MKPRPQPSANLESAAAGRRADELAAVLARLRQSGGRGLRELERMVRDARAEQLRAELTR